MRTGVAAVLLLAVAGARASAAPTKNIAALAVDVDGDGVADTIELGDDGALRIYGKRAGEVQFADHPTRATLAAGPVQGAPAIVASVTTARGQLGYVVTHGAQGWHIAWQGEIGGVGLDAEYSVELAGTPSGVLRYQARPGVTRCDGKPAYLFAEGFDGTAFQRRAKLPVDIDASSPTLVAKPDTAPGAQAVSYHAQWTSSERGADDAGGLARPSELDDGDPTTAWHGDPATDGDGQFVTFVPRGKLAKPVQLRIVAGDHASAAALARAARPKQLAIATSSGTWRVDLPDAAHESLQTAYVVDLPPGLAGCVTIVVASTYPGQAKQSIAMSELAIYAEGERGGGGEAMLASTIAKGDDGEQAAAIALANRGAAAVPAIDAELARTTDAGARGRLMRVVVKIHDPAAVPLLARAAASGWVDGDDAIAVARALGELHAERELRDLAGKHDNSLDVRLAAARAIDVATPDGAAAVLDLAGLEPRELRHAVIDKLSALPASRLVAAAQLGATPAIAGDLWRAATRAAHATPADRDATLAAMTAALATAPDYERRYRLVDGIATLGDAAALRTLGGQLGGFSPAESSALRQVAARAIGAAPRPDGIELVLALARDGDPGVRLGALAALMQASDDGKGAPWGGSVDSIDGALATALAGDAWSDVKKRAAQALGLRCQRPGPAQALAAAAMAPAGDRVDREGSLAGGATEAWRGSIDVRVEALGALVACHAAGTAELLAKTWDDDKAPLELRARAIGLAIALGDRALGAKLVARFETWRGASLESKDAVALAMEAANAIGRLGAPGAATALIDALDDSAFPEIVGAAAAGLGSLGSACTPAAKVKLDALARSDDQQVRLPARRAAAVCGK